MMAARLALVVVSTLVASGCRKPHAAAADAGAAGAMVVTVDAASTLAPARCQPTPGAPEIVASLLGESIDFGGAVLARGEAFVGLIRSNQGRRLASVARVADGGRVLVVDLGVALADGPAPTLVVRGDEVLAGAFVRGESADGGPFERARKLSVFRLLSPAREASAGGAPELLVSVPQQSDDSPAFDVAAGGRVILAWDEDLLDGASPASPEGGPRKGAGRGIIKVSALAADLRTAEAPRVVSPDTSDADLPSLAPRTGGYWAAWIAHRPEPAADAGDAAGPPGSDLEGPAEARGYQWLELLMLDEDAKPVGGIRRLTPASGHVSAYTLVPHGVRLEVLARDDDEATDGAGGRILRITVEGDAVESPVPLVAEGAGRGEPVWLTDGQGEAKGHTWLWYEDVGDHGRLLPLGEGGRPNGPISLEPSLDDARPLILVGPTLLAAAPTDDRHLLRSLTCAP
jgi:hypothetical protein